MNLGHNSNVQVNGTAYHVQTEDRGADHPFIDTTVYSGGRVVHRRTASYADLLKTDGDLQLFLQKRVEDQHRAVIDEIRAGSLQLETRGLAANNSGNAAASTGEGILVTLINASSWIQSGHANLQIEVRARKNSQPKVSAKIVATLEGALSPAEFEAYTNAQGLAEIKFPFPKMSPEGGALVIRASSGSDSDQIRYQLKSKLRTPPTPAIVP